MITNKNGVRFLTPFFIRKLKNHYRKYSWNFFMYFRIIEIDNK